MRKFLGLISLLSGVKWLKEKIEAKELLNAHRIKATYFTRSTMKLPFSLLVGYLLTNNRTSAQIGLNMFYRSLKESEPVTKQSYFEARDKIEYTAFSSLADEFADKIIRESQLETFQGYHLVAVDGSIFEVPASASKDFGVLATAGNPVAKAQAISFVDILNGGLILKAELGPYKSNERDMAEKILKEIDMKASDTFLFDRGFYSKKLIQIIDEKGAKFVFRVKRDCQKDIKNAHQEDQIIKVEGRQTRVINIKLASGETEKIVTNIINDLKPIDFYKLYGKRWGIEVNYLMLKERLQIENFTSGKKRLILQDFYAAVMVYNLSVLAFTEAKLKLKKKTEVSKLKYEYKPNMNIALSEIKQLLIYAVCGPNETRDWYFEQLQHSVLKNAVPIRPNRSFPRIVKNKTAKYPLNKKRNI
jgi:hypothetical protein